jgi:general secretion pathway protein A
MDLRSRFGFHTTPFTREIGVEHHYRLPWLDETADAVVGCIERRMSAAVVGPAGCGKTALARRIDHALPEARYQVSYVKVTGVSKRDMCRELCRACGAKPAGSYPALVDRLQERFAQSCGTEGRRPVVVLDEAHDLRPDVLAMLRILTNFEWDSRLVVSLLLVGQMPLRRMLASEEQEAVARRLAHIATLRLLSRDETARYIEHRCAVAGAATVPFDEAAIDAIYELGRGNLRATDCLALESLLLCDRQGQEAVSAAQVAVARRNLWP